MQLNDVTRLLINLLLEDRGLTGRELLAEIANSINHPQPSVVIDKGEELLRELRDKDILLGSRPS
jgi:hypothetical protein